MTKTKYIFIVLIILLLGSCEKPVDFDPGEVSPYVVMISKPVSDSLMTVYVGYSHFFLDNRSFNTVTDASVTITDGSGSYTGLYDPKCFFQGYGYSPDYDDYYYSDSMFYGGYTFTLRPRPGDTLRLTATVPGYDKVITAKTTMPLPPTIEVIDYIVDTTETYGYYDEYGGYYSGGSSYYYKIRFKVKSHGTVEHYSIRLDQAGYLKLDDLNYVWDTTSWNQCYFNVNDPIVNSSDIEDILDGYDGSFSGVEMLFSNEMFKDGEHEFTAVFSIWSSEYGGLDYANIPIRLVAKTMSSELYRYEQTSANAHYDSFDGLFQEPVQVICNVKGGVGIFGGCSSRRYALPQPRYGSFQHNDGYYNKAKK